MTGREYRGTNKVEERISAARREIKKAIDKDKTMAALKAAGARSIDPEAVETITALAEERMAEIIANSVEWMEKRNETTMKAGSVAVAAQKEAEERSIRREFEKIFA